MAPCASCQPGGSTTKETDARRITRSRGGNVEPGISITPNVGERCVRGYSAGRPDDYEANGERSLIGRFRKQWIPACATSSPRSKSCYDERWWLADVQRAATRPIST
jgi:hypothetical protein